MPVVVAAVVPRAVPVLLPWRPLLPPHAAAPNARHAKPAPSNLPVLTFFTCRTSRREPYRCGTPIAAALIRVPPYVAGRPLRCRSLQPDGESDCREGEDDGGDHSDPVQVALDNRRTGRRRTQAATE